MRDHLKRKESEKNDAQEKYLKVTKAATDHLVAHTAKQTQYDIVKSATNHGIARML